METIWLPIKDISKEGKTLSYNEETTFAWFDDISPSTIEFTLTKSPIVEITVQKEEMGIFISGSFSGEVSIPCPSCLEPVTLTVGHFFQDFIEASEEGNLEEEGSYVRISPKGLGVEIHISGIIIEEFLLDCSGIVRCSEECLGLCPKCGINKNLASCSCITKPEDPRFEKLRGLTLEKNN